MWIPTGFHSNGILSEIEIIHGLARQSKEFGRGDYPKGRGLQLLGALLRISFYEHISTVIHQAFSAAIAFGTQGQ